MEPSVSQASPLSRDQAAPYRVLALETRPQTLGALVGQETVRKVLGDMITSGRLPHALLLTGTRGTGKTSTARIFAKSLCCASGPTLEPCGHCPHCEAITASAHEDVLEIDGASNTGVDQIRELRESARFYPRSARYKIFIIDEVHMLSIGAFNALLKTLEEPPPQVIFVLATTEVGKVPATVRSRCMVLPFRKVDVATLADHLHQVLQLRQLEADHDALVLIAREGRGSFRDALSLLEQAIPYAENGHLSAGAVHNAFGMRDRECARNIFLAMARRDLASGLAALDQADGLGFDFARLMQQVSEYARFAILLKIEGAAQKDTAANGGPEASSLRALFDELLSNEKEELIEATRDLSRTALAECFRLTQQATQEMARSSYPRPWAELALLDAADRTQWIDTGDLLTAVTRLATHGDGLPPVDGSSLAAQLNPGRGPSERHHQHRQGHGQGQAPAAAAPSLPPPPASPAPSATPRKEGDQAAASPTEPLNLEASSNVDLAKLRTWIGLVSERSMPLGAKLRHARFEMVSPERVRLAATSDNALFGSITDSDRTILEASLKAMGWASARLEGFHVQGSPAAGARDKTSARRPETAPKGPAPAPARASGPALKGATAATPPRSEPMPSPTVDPFAAAPEESAAAYESWAQDRQQRQHEALSLSSVEETSARKELDDKRRRLMSHPFFVKLGAVASHVQIETTEAHREGPDK